jgi:hypothetical protein
MARTLPSLALVTILSLSLGACASCASDTEPQADSTTPASLDETRVLSTLRGGTDLDPAIREYFLEGFTVDELGAQPGPRVELSGYAERRELRLAGTSGKIRVRYVFVKPRE